MSFRTFKRPMKNIDNKPICNHYTYSSRNSKRERLEAELELYNHHACTAQSLKLIVDAEIIVNNIWGDDLARYHGTRRETLDLAERI